MRVQANGEEFENVAVDSVVKEGDVIFPILFNYVIDSIIMTVFSTHEGVAVGKDLEVTDLRLC